MRIISGLLTFLVSAYLFSCTPEWGEGNEEMIVEAWIESGGNPVVILSSTIRVSNRETSLEDCIVATAKVTVSDGDTCVVLRGGIDRHYFPPYTYTSSHIEGVAGKSYTLDIDYHGSHYTANTTIPEVCGFDSLEIYPIRDTSAYGINASFLDSLTSHKWYQFFVKRQGKDSRFLPAVFGLIDNMSINRLTTTIDTVRNSITHKLYPGYSGIDNEQYNMYFEPNDTLRIKLATMDSISAAFWQSFQNLESTSGFAAFLKNEKLEGNVPGAKGYWCGYGVSERCVIVK